MSKTISCPQDLAEHTNLIASELSEESFASIWDIARLIWKILSDEEVLVVAKVIQDILDEENEPTNHVVSPKTIEEIEELFRLTKTESH
mgnify:CR=1 FL=1